MIKVLFICHGNICRSTMAEYVMKDLVKKANLESSFYIDSAGTSNEEDGNPVHYGTQNKLREEGIPCGNHRARQMTRRDYEEFDYLIGMEQWNIRNINLLTQQQALEVLKDPYQVDDWVKTILQERGKVMAAFIGNTNHSNSAMVKFDNSFC